MDYDLRNQTRAESLRETFYEAIEDGNWPIARDMLSLMEDMHISTYEFRREMNKAMAETDDITYEPFESKIPLMTEHERELWADQLTWGGRSNKLTFGCSDELLNQERLSAEHGPNNA